MPYPARFPLVRIDQILVGGVRTDRAWSLPATGSDHHPVAAGSSWRKGGFARYGYRDTETFLTGVTRTPRAAMTTRPA